MWEREDEGRVTKNSWHKERETWREEKVGKWAKGLKLKQPSNQNSYMYIGEGYHILIS